MSLIDARLDVFRDLHKNIWFHVMNWVLDEMRIPKERRGIHALCGHCFYFRYKDIPSKSRVFNYDALW